MPETTEPDNQLAITNPLVAQQLKVVTEAIAVSLSVREVTVDYTKRRDAATAIVYEFTKPPTNDEEQEEIKLAKRAVAKLRTEFEKNADALKVPLNAAVDRINAHKKKQLELLKKCEGHGDGLINNYQQRLTDARNAEKARVEAKQKAIADLAAQAQREQEEAERKRQQAEIAAQQAKDAATKAERDKAAAEAQRLKEEASKLDADAYGSLLAAEMAPTPAAVSAPPPQAREVRDFIIAGANGEQQKKSLIALLAAHPEFFTAEVKSETPRSFVLRLRIADVVDALNGKEPFPKLESSPGIEVRTHLTTLR